ncbi:MAG: TonB-dependent receptor [Sulfurimonas sp.]|jgi:iron complex outermembrane receptor protein|uniref:TonB-dependent receptor plug domain-containing protein n=1 Tax=unclassified Sulfurimonas TaxID=2623549 RepID=UPI0008D6FEFB|nr:TonB-dependent receptor [Sulfurimonas sp. RIFOXYB12_FULL_35_9]OHE03519.1 MAG: TonB-dependent receptor [Sulfurimonas sp. RIFOXYB12_FULL_35_9]
MKKSIFGLSIVTSMLLAESFTLGQVSVLENIKDINLFEQSISPEVISQNSSDTVSEALDNLSGVNQDVQGGRGESTLYIRGFDAKRVGVFIDGIPVYVPYDGNFDYGRFLTTDIGSIDVSKGYSSVVYGGNTMGGVVNIVSRKPTKEFEGNAKAKIVLDSDAKMAKHVESVNIGTKQGNFYGQLGANYSKQDHFRISDDYEATATQPEGERLRSEAQDKKISLKAGYLADDKSEIAISYVNQQGEKQQPPVTDTTFAKNKDWDWPYWDKETVSITGQKNFDSSYVKALAYYDKSKNSVWSYDNATFSSITKNWAFKSRYDDYSYGARLEYGIELGENFIKAAANYKKDVHRAYDKNKTTNVESLVERYEDNTVSLGLEDVYNITSKLEFLAGVSYDKKEAHEIYDTNAAYLNMLALETQDSFSPQTALVYSLDDSSKVKGSISRKTYMPSMKDRYSRKFNSYVPNVDLKNETATHYELSYLKKYNALTSRANIFLTRVDDAIQSIVHAPSGLLQNQNVGTFDHRGVELELNYKADALEIGGNYTYISIKNKDNGSVEIVDVPKHQFFTFAQKEVAKNVSLYANMKFRDGAYENKLNGTYVTNPNFTTFDLKAIYEPTKNLTAEIGIKNLTDELVRYDMAYPMAGREFFASLDYKF